jgi:catechol 2,3-dioxygenase-like lactoylglutathione lyase family enzyme
MTIQRMDNVLIVVDDLEAAKSFFIELGLEFGGETQVEGPSVDSLIGLKNVRAPRDDEDPGRQRSHRARQVPHAHRDQVWA